MDRSSELGRQFAESLMLSQIDDDEIFQLIDIQSRRSANFSLFYSSFLSSFTERLTINLGAIETLQQTLTLILKLLKLYISHVNSSFNQNNTTSLTLYCSFLSEIVALTFRSLPFFVLDGIENANCEVYYNSYLEWLEFLKTCYIPYMTLTSKLEYDAKLKINTQQIIAVFAMANYVSRYGLMLDFKGNTKSFDPLEKFLLHAICSFESITSLNPLGVISKHFVCIFKENLVTDKIRISSLENLHKFFIGSLVSCTQPYAEEGLLISAETVEEWRRLCIHSKPSEFSQIAETHNLAQFSRDFLVFDYVFTQNTYFEVNKYSDAYYLTKTSNLASHHPDFHYRLLKEAGEQLVLPDINVSSLKTRGLILQRCIIIQEAFGGFQYPLCCHCNNSKDTELLFKWKILMQVSNDICGKKYVRTNLFDIFFADLHHLLVKIKSSSARIEKLMSTVKHFLIQALEECPSKHYDILTSISESNWAALKSQRLNYSNEGFYLLPLIYSVLSEYRSANAQEISELPWQLFFVKSEVPEVFVNILLDLQKKDKAEGSLRRTLLFLNMLEHELKHEVGNNYLSAVSKFFDILRKTANDTTNIRSCEIVTPYLEIKSLLIQNSQRLYELAKLFMATSAESMEQNTAIEEGEFTTADDIDRCSHTFSKSLNDPLFTLERTDKNLEEGSEFSGNASNPLLLNNTILEPEFEAKNDFFAMINEMALKWSEFVCQYSYSYFNKLLEKIIDLVIVTEPPRLLEHVLLEFIKINPVFIETVFSTIIKKFGETKFKYNEEKCIFKPLIYMFKNDVDNSSGINFKTQILKTITIAMAHIRTSRKTIIKFLYDLLKFSKYLRESYFCWVLNQMDLQVPPSNQNNLDLNFLIKELVLNDKSEENLIIETFIPLYLTEDINSTKNLFFFSKRLFKRWEKGFGFNRLIRNYFSAVHISRNFVTEILEISLRASIIEEGEDVDDTIFKSFSESLYREEDEGGYQILLGLETVLLITLDEADNSESLKKMSLPSMKHKKSQSSSPMNISKKKELNWFFEYWIKQIVETIVGSKTPTQTVAYHLLKFLSSHKTLFPKLFMQEYQGVSGLSEIFKILTNFEEEQNANLVVKAILDGVITALHNTVETFENYLSWVFCVIPLYQDSSIEIKQEILENFICEGIMQKLYEDHGTSSNLTQLYVQKFFEGMINIVFTQMNSTDFIEIFVSILKAIIRSGMEDEDNNFQKFLKRNKFLGEIKKTFEDFFFNVCVNLMETDDNDRNNHKSSSDFLEVCCKGLELLWNLANSSIMMQSIKQSLITDNIEPLVFKTSEYIVFSSLPIMDSLFTILNSVDYKNIKERCLQILTKIFQGKIDCENTDALSASNNYFKELSLLECNIKLLVKLLQHPKLSIKCYDFIMVVLLYEAGEKFKLTFSSFGRGLLFSTLTQLIQNLNCTEEMEEGESFVEEIGLECKLILRLMEIDSKFGLERSIETTNEFSFAIISQLLILLDAQKANNNTLSSKLHSTIYLLAKNAFEFIKSSPNQHILFDKRFLTPDYEYR